MALASLLKFAVLAVFMGLIAAPCASSNSEGDALHAFRRSLSDPDNVLQSWDPTLVNPCTWFHITCNQNNRVTRVDLGNSNLSGRLVPELGRLEHLQYLELYKNNIQGNIPEEFGNLKNLISLDLYNNSITGEIPPSLGNLKLLVFLRLNNNWLTGQIPRELTAIPSLKVVDVSNNNLCGTIPTTGPFERFPLKKGIWKMPIGKREDEKQAKALAILRATHVLKALSCRGWQHMIPDVDGSSQGPGMNFCEDKIFIIDLDESPFTHVFSMYLFKSKFYCEWKCAFKCT